MILTEKKLVERFTKKNCKIEKVINYILNGSYTIIRLIAGWIKKT